MPNFTGQVVNEKAVPIPGVKAYIAPSGNYDLSGEGVLWSLADSNGNYSIYYDGDLTGYSLYLDAGQTAAEYSPAAAYNARAVILEKKPFPWWVILVGAGLFYVIRRK